MNNYETVFVATPVLSDVQFKELVSKFQGIITENGGQIVHNEDWGLRKLAYPIQKKTTGFYYLIQFEAEGDLIDKLETQFRRDEKVIRFLTFKMDKHAVVYAVKRINKNKEVKEAIAEVAAEIEEVVETAKAAEAVAAVETIVEAVAAETVAKEVEITETKENKEE